jgi:hypothetical protein
MDHLAHRRTSPAAHLAEILCAHDLIFVSVVNTLLVLLILCAHVQFSEPFLSSVTLGKAFAECFSGRVLQTLGKEVVSGSANRPLDK